ncbi:Nucleoside-diphosphate-sugar epimerase [Aquiflexum balticum DSM 16537]|uniref:Nucleoside-diphosphate-sugar epimerase n=1 Tax=Aquiflexum balticum DSM 16537 TaxID=758820 RepID=A0A1W2H090_9BACT|nr:NAD-dependent epimerase/dehydratase family protein [Aquiflexum balticum]SMD42052.1 Nucleoside-diphosphate-sugar epimerase [Aquiflexum balticum DSM 16537]
MKILITGATGLFGSYLAKKFGAIGEIYGLRRENSSQKLLQDSPYKINWIEGDILEPISLGAALEQMDLVIHAAGMVSFDPKDEKKLMEVNVTGTTNLVNAMLEKGVHRLIHVSSVSALGRSADTLSYDENSKWTASRFNTPYAISKYRAELEVWRGVQEGLQALIIMPSVILGKISDERSSTQIYHYVLEENKYYPQGTVNFIDIRDAVEITFQLYQKGQWGQRYILNHKTLYYKDFFEKMAKAFGKKPPTKKLQWYQLKMALIVVGIAKMLKLSKNPLNKQTAMISQLELYLQNEKVQKILDYKYIPLEETFQWALSNESQ